MPGVGVKKFITWPTKISKRKLGDAKGLHWWERHYRVQASIMRLSHLNINLLNLLISLSMFLCLCLFCMSPKKAEPIKLNIVESFHLAWLSF